jgi:predicted outer membrane repeat protein
MKYLIGLTITFYLPMTAFSANTEEGTQTITERKIIAQEQMSQFTQKIKDKSVSGIGRYYIGADGSCDFSTIQIGINATIGDMNAPELLIASNKTYDENLVLNNINMFMDGSYSNCSDARNGIHGGNGAIITGASGSSSPIITTLGSSGGSFTYQISLQNLKLQNSNGVGIQTLSSGAIISLDNILFAQLSGGGIKVEGVPTPRTHILMTNSVFVLNSSINGGAIRCSGTNNLIVLEDTTIAGNSSSGDGGAVYLEQACDFSMTGNMIIDNITDGRGGAIYAELGSDIIIEKVQLTNNRAVSDGGAIYAVDGATTIDGSQLHFINNSSDAAGGAISLHNGASFMLKQTSLDCIDPKRCNFFDGNESVNTGGAISNQDGHLDISSTYFEENRSNIGTAIHSSGSTSSTRIEGSIFNHNGDNGSGNIADIYVISAASQADITTLYSTFADNNAETATFGTDNNNAGMNIRSSIINDTSSGLVYDGEFISSTYNCLLVHNVQGLQIGVGFRLVGNPQYINPSIRNYHLKTNSPAIDLCSSTDAFPRFKDIDFRLRGINSPLTVNILGVFDAGADESYPQLIFADSFE